jgi:hypothetical protein
MQQHVRCIIYNWIKNKSNIILLIKILFSKNEANIIRIYGNMEIPLNNIYLCN